MSSEFVQIMDHLHKQDETLSDLRVSVGRIDQKLKDRDEQCRKQSDEIHAL